MAAMPAAKGIKSAEEGQTAGHTIQTGPTNYPRFSQLFSIQLFGRSTRRSVVLRSGLEAGCDDSLPAGRGLILRSALGLQLFRDKAPVGHGVSLDQALRAILKRVRQRIGPRRSSPAASCLLRSGRNPRAPACAGSIPRPRRHPRECVAARAEALSVGQFGNGVVVGLALLGAHPSQRRERNQYDPNPNAKFNFGFHSPSAPPSPMQSHLTTLPQCKPAANAGFVVRQIHALNFRGPARRSLAVGGSWRQIHPPQQIGKARV